jgi:hypothetical protein
MNPVLAFWRSATADERDPISKIRHWPSEIAVTKAGFAGRVHPYPGGMMDTGRLNHGAYDDSEDHAEAAKKYEPKVAPKLFTFVRRIQLFPQRWHDMDRQKVDLSQPIHAMQPFVHKSHLEKYLNEPDAPTQAMENVTDSKNRRALEHYPFTHHPGFVKYQGRMHCVDGHHRVAAALMRGDSHIEGKVWDADKHGLPLEATMDHGWPDEDPGPPHKNGARGESS